MIELLILVLVVVVAFSFMFSRSVSAGHGKLLFWLVWFICGLCGLLALPNEYRPVAQVMSWVWAAGWLGLPLYWFGQKIYRQRRRTP